ncbi:hypothetical protein RFI_19476, partial [Reticulomyxa filosa]
MTGKDEKKQSQSQEQAITNDKEQQQQQQQQTFEQFQSQYQEMWPNDAFVTNKGLDELQTKLADAKDDFQMIRFNGVATFETNRALLRRCGALIKQYSAASPASLQRCQSLVFAQNPVKHEKPILLISF